MRNFFRIHQMAFFMIVLLMTSMTPSQAQLRHIFNLTSTEFNGSNIRGSHFGQGLEAVDEGGNQFVFEDFKDKISLVYFGFTLCPDICPTTLVQIKQLMALLTAEETKQVRFYFITVDPERDTSERLKEYLAYFDPNFKGLIGSPSQLEQMAKSFNVFYNKVPTTVGQYTMEHSAYVFVLDQEGESVLLFREGMSPEEMAADLKKLLVP
ncbi:MAG: SCO family protein [Alcaligenaceae bacterium]|nr:SCO family protein [Alcaligenaceae bacterium]